MSKEKTEVMDAESTIELQDAVETTEDAVEAGTANAEKDSTEPTKPAEKLETEAVDTPEADTAAQANKEKAAARAADRQRKQNIRQALDAADYMGSAFTLSSVTTSVREEIRNIEDIIANNKRVTQTGRGEYKYILAMMTGNDEERENGDHNKLIATSVTAMEVFQNDDGTETYGTLKLLFSGDDFTAYSGIIPDGSEGNSALLRRQRSYTNHAPGSKFQCVPVQVHRDENGRVDCVVCSRAFAMEQMQNRFFFGKNPLAKVGGVAYAYVMAADDNGVRVECMGIETRINRGQLTSRRLVLRAGDIYKPGMKIPVVIRELEISKDENETPVINKIVLSGVAYEIQQGLVHSVTEFDLSKKPHELADVVSITPNYYIVRLTRFGIIGLIAKDRVLNSADLKRGDKVFMEIVRVNEKYNRVMGNCFKV